MTEKEKMLNGEYYDSRDPELIKIYHHARKLLKQYNFLDSELIQQRERFWQNCLASRAMAFGLKPRFFVIMEKIFPSGKTPL